MVRPRVCHPVFDGLLGVDAKTQPQAKPTNGYDHSNPVGLVNIPFEIIGFTTSNWNGAGGSTSIS
ncbi:hypothetical protein OK016_25625 [Vibrio chagasii]|nr:hypothetical protein [Vibrio chagasii]